jgi:hypothetical protein
MDRFTRTFAAVLMLFLMTAVTLADGQMSVPLTCTSTTDQTCSASSDQTDTTLQGQTDTPPVTGDYTGQMDIPLTDAGLILLQSFSSIY